DLVMAEPPQVARPIAPLQEGEIGLAVGVRLFLARLCTANSGLLRVKFQFVQQLPQGPARFRRRRRLVTRVTGHLVPGWWCPGQTFQGQPTAVAGAQMLLQLLALQGRYCIVQQLLEAGRVRTGGWGSHWSFRSGWRLLFTPGINLLPQTPEDSALGN